MSARLNRSMLLVALSVLLVTGAAVASDKDADQPPVARAQSGSGAPTQDAEHVAQNSTTFNDVTADVHSKFDSLDTDHDGTIDQKEASVSNILGSQFSALDTNADGKLSITEFAAASDLASIKTADGNRDRQEK